MEDILAKYEPVIGLEIHVQLNTASKAYASDATSYGEEPNSKVSPVTLGHPGTLPMFNAGVLQSAVKLGLACNCTIREVNEFARKNYFYADLPKGYQITQDKTPICNGGYLEIKDAEGKEKKLNLTRIHMEEDSGKSSHDIDPFNTLIDLNRAGTPLLEIVSEPEFKDGTEAYNYLNEMRKLVRYLDISDGNMEEGSLRCDVNISVKPKGRKKFGTKVEVKNLNSFRNVQKSIDFEIKRQVALIEEGGKVTQQTRTFDASTGKTQVLRAKEDAHDYRYFNEPDLQPILVREDYIQEIKSKLPALPKALFAKYQKLGLNEYDAQLLTESKEVAAYYEAIIEHTKNYKAAANWIMGSIKSYLNDKAISITSFPLKPKVIAQLQDLVDAGKVSNSAASGDLFKALIEQAEKTQENEKTLSPAKFAQKLNLIQESNADELMTFVKAALAKYPDKVESYRNGKKGVQGLFMGEVMKLSKGKADPKVASKLVTQELEK
jgi:aspartyl-tRNA(Asn)/glutamyl-tRNA(Gln) amidotransferase subunit B